MRPFSTEIWFGDRVGVLGSNGSGKSHFLRLLARGGSRSDVEHEPVESLDIALRLATDSAAAAASASAAAAHALSYKPATGSCEATTMCDRFLRTACVESATVVDQL